MAKNEDRLADAKKLMGSLVRMKPKPHEDIKRGAKKIQSRSRNVSTNQNRKKRRAGLGPDTAAD